MAVLISLAVGQQTRGQETLTAVGENPSLRLEDNVDPLRTWSVNGNDTEFTIHNGQWHALFITPDAQIAALFLDDNRVGFGTEFPQKHLHVLDGNTPTLRLEQEVNSPQIWDIQSSHLGFDIVDATNSNVRPFRIKPGAPTDSFLMDATGRIGLGTAAPDANSRMDVRSTLLNGLLLKSSAASGHYLRVENSGGIFRSGVQGNGDAQFGALSPTKGLNLLAGGTSKMTINSDGQVSFGNPPPAVPPADAMMTQTGAHLTLAGVWTDFSSRTGKQDIEPITSEQARDTVRALQPMTYRYKVQPEEPYAGFIAEDVPELVATSDRKSLAPMDFVAVLTKVVQDQSVQLDEQKTQLEDQRTAMAKQRELNQRLEQLLDEQRKQANEQQTTLATLLKRLEGIERNANGAPAK
ncbi:MAG: tail fiber domain-containing protein [Candidatus Saccharimonas sp.]|nr:tail fiber domain-containing protein [Planctomycetaceae bacterium]